MLFTGIIVGFLIAAVLGPIGFLCIRRTLIEGPLIGLAVGIGSVFADGIYASIAAFGMTVVFNSLFSYVNILSVFGGLYLIYLGIVGYKTMPTHIPLSLSKSNILMTLISTFFLTLTSPVTIISFLAAFTSFNIVGQQVSFLQSSMLVGGVLT